MIDPRLVCLRGGHAPSSVVDSIGAKAGSAWAPIEAAAIRRVKALSQSRSEADDMSRTLAYIGRVQQGI